MHRTRSSSNRFNSQIHLPSSLNSVSPEVSIWKQLRGDQSPDIEQQRGPLGRGLDPHGRVAGLWVRQGKGALQSGPVGEHHAVVGRRQNEHDRGLGAPTSEENNDVEDLFGVTYVV